MIKHYLIIKIRMFILRFFQFAKSLLVGSTSISIQHILTSIFYKYNLQKLITTKKSFSLIFLIQRGKLSLYFLCNLFKKFISFPLIQLLINNLLFCSPLSTFRFTTLNLIKKINFHKKLPLTFLTIPKLQEHTKNGFWLRMEI